MGAHTHITPCAACDEPLDRDQQILMPCLHVLCTPCADAELHDGRTIVCPFLIEDGLTCSEHGRSQDDLHRPGRIDAMHDDEATLAVLRQRTDEVTANIDGLAVALAELKIRGGTSCSPAIKALGDQRDALLVLRSRFYAALAHPRHAARLLALRPSMELAAKTAPHPDRGVDFVYVNRLNQLLFRSQRRDYREKGKPVRAIGSNGGGPGQFGYPGGLAMDPEGNLVVGEVGSFRIQVVTQQGCHLRFPVRPSNVHGIAVEPNGSIWSAVGRSRLCLFNARTGAIERTIACAGAVGLCRLDDGALVVSCRGENKVVCFDPDGKLRWLATGKHLKNVGGIAAIPDQQLLAVCDHDGWCIRLLTQQDGQLVRTITEVSSPVGILFDPVAQVLVVGEHSGISAWTLDGQFISRWAQHCVDVVYGLVITPDGTLFASDWGNHRIVVF